MIGTFFEITYSKEIIMRKISLQRIVTLLVITVLFLSCKESDVNLINAPKCIENKIEEIINHEVTNPPTQVWKWDVDNQIYYYITSNCCDQYNYLYTENCDILCAPDGGLTGNGDGNCPLFTSEIVKTLVWKDDRK